MGYHSEPKTPEEIRAILRKVQAAKVARAESSQEASRIDRELHIKISGGIQRNHRGLERSVWTRIGPRRGRRATGIKAHDAADQDAQTEHLPRRLRLLAEGGCGHFR